MAWLVTTLVQVKDVLRQHIKILKGDAIKVGVLLTLDEADILQHASVKL